jgi:hypothetical protein
MGIERERWRRGVPSLMLLGSLAGGCKTLMRCSISLELANLSSRIELRTVCSVADQGFWLERHAG